MEKRDTKMATLVTQVLWKCGPQRQVSGEQRECVWSILVMALMKPIIPHELPTHLKSSISNNHEEWLLR